MKEYQKADLVSAYEEVWHMPQEKRITENDPAAPGYYRFKDDTSEVDKAEMTDRVLGVLGIMEEEYRYACKTDVAMRLYRITGQPLPVYIRKFTDITALYEEAHA